jgi:uncharacterized protein (TIGR03435 family)
MLLKRAYDVKPEQISGPGWLETERYDIVAKLLPGTNAEQLRLMLQELLTQRFQISLHREVKILSVYELTVTKNGSKLKMPEKLPEYEDDEERKAEMQKRASAAVDAMTAKARSGDFLPHRSLHLASATTAKFAEVLSSQLDRAVKDRTQLEGLYAFTLNWVADVHPMMGRIVSTGADNDTPSAPSIFAAIQEQLGLRLQPKKEPIEVLVIDKAERSPTSN